MPTKGEKAFFAQTEVIGNGKGNQANLIMSLGFPGTVRVPLVGPFIPDSEIQEIEGQINAGAFLIKL